MAGQPTKKGSWGDWAIIERKPAQKRISCSFCAFYCSDQSCRIHPIIISDVGYNFWRKCDSFLLDIHHDTPENRQKVNGAKGTGSPYHPDNDKLLQTLKRKCRQTAVESTIDQKTLRGEALLQQILRSNSAPRSLSNDCRHAKYIQQTDSFECMNARSPHFAKQCQRCPHYKKEKLIVKVSSRKK